MSTQPRPLRKLKRWGRVLIRLGKCPTCGGRLDALSQQDVAAWHNYPPPGFVSRQWGAGSHGRMMKGHIIELHKSKIPHCPSCNHTFVHGWVYPAEAAEGPS